MSGLRLAVVGTGVMGANHVRVAKRTEGVTLAAVVDADVERAQAAAGDSGAVALSRVEDLPDDVEAAVIAVPTAAHLATASALIERGIHVLVEKPLAASVADAQTITQLAADRGVVLAVGHVERFNPAAVELMEFIDEPIHVATTRVGPYSPRISDGVVFDLMIHDLDIVCAIAGDEASVVSAQGVARRVRSESEDTASVTLAFDSGLTAALTASRLGQQKVRSVEVTQAESTLTADLVRADLTIHRMAHHEFLGEEGVSYRQSNVVEIPFISQRGEPLGLELLDFVGAVQTGGRPRVDGAAGVRAVQLASDVVAALLIS